MFKNLTILTMDCPGNWSVEEVAKWAQEASLPEVVIDALIQNGIDGPTLVTLSKADLQLELGIQSLSSRRYLWDMIESIKAKNENIESLVALECHETEIERLASNFSKTELSSSKYDTEVVAALMNDAVKQRQVLEDHLYAFKLMSPSSVQLYDDMRLARQEQIRLDELLVRSEFDRTVAMAESNQGLDRESTDQTLFNLCIEACSRNKIDVAEALRSERHSALQQWRDRGLQQVPKAVQEFDDSVEETAIGEEEYATKIPANRPVEEATSGTEKIFESMTLPVADQCDSCFDEHVEVFALSCKHLYCIRCMTGLFRTALHDTSLLPLVCCELPIDMNLAPILLAKKEAADFSNRVAERMATNKMYCSACSQFINLDLLEQSLSKRLDCSCGQGLCVECKTADHPRLTCEENKSGVTASNATLLNVARNNGWKQCPQCAIMIELRSGCNHMVCGNCDHDFCFRCLKSWDINNGTCSSRVCEVWDEDRLVEAAEARVNQGPPIRAAVRRQRMQAEMNALRGNEGCQHAWVRSTRVCNRECERCGFYLYVYGMTCQSGCRATVCYTCANHRIPRYGWR